MSTRSFSHGRLERNLNLFPKRSVDEYARIEALAADPRPHRCVKLAGSDDLWWIRVGDYRVLYAIDDALQVIDVIAVRHRKDAYS
jgi:mRNA-degrading endonuclease RelE of RelBE toxin-antitoxin system